MKTILFVTVSVAVGAVGGLGAGLYLAKPEAKARAAEAPAVAGGRDDSVARAALQPREPGARSGELLPTAQPSAAALDATTKSAPRLTPEESAARWQQMYSGKIAAVQGEGRDAGWARAAEASFQQDFQDAAGTFEARLVGLDCRTTGCLARVEWSSYATAKRKFQDILHANYKVNCGTTVDIGPAPERTDAPVQATVVFDCEQSRISELGG